MTVPHYDRAGELIDFGQWVALFEKRGYQSILKTRRGGYYVSTVWLGIDHSFGGPVPIIFETMIFRRTRGRLRTVDLYCRRYSTESQALRGHSDACRMIRSGWRPAYDDAIRLP